MQSTNQIQLTQPILESLLDPALTPTQICQAHNLTLPDLLELTNSDEYKQTTSAIEQINTNRQSTINLNLRTQSLAILRDIITDTTTAAQDYPKRAHIFQETARKATITLLKHTAPPGTLQTAKASAKIPKQVSIPTGESSHGQLRHQHTPPHHHRNPLTPARRRAQSGDRWDILSLAHPHGHLLHPRNDPRDLCCPQLTPPNNALYIDKQNDKQARPAQRAKGRPGKSITDPPRASRTGKLEPKSRLQCSTPTPNKPGIPRVYSIIRKLFKNFLSPSAISIAAQRVKPNIKQMHLLHRIRVHKLKPNLNALA